MNQKTYKVAKTDIEWKQQLTPQQFAVARQAATERPFTGEYVHNHDAGTYNCVACGQPLFSSDTKFESGSGWPSFWDVIQNGNVELKEDYSHGMHRVEAVCSNCGSHLGHVFDDGPADTTGQRYCINSASLAFKKKDEVK
jgi:peptide-methionine (R)-S-oxide reductase